LIERNRGQVVGEKSFGAGYRAATLYTPRRRLALLLTTVKWAKLEWQNLPLAKIVLIQASHLRLK
jgi:hypothetical protein